MVSRREIALAIVLSIVTCGIYSLYWVYKLNEEVNTLSGHPDDMSGAAVVLLSLITCGIYGLIWFYQMGNKVDEENIRRGGRSESRGIIYLLISLCGFSIISIALLQDSVNKLC